MPDALQRRWVRCPSCGSAVEVPAPASPPSPDSAVLVPPPMEARTLTEAERRAQAFATADPVFAGSYRSQARTGGPARLRQTGSWREYAYLGLIVALMPLVFHVWRPGAESPNGRIRRAPAAVPAETAEPLEALDRSGKLTLDGILYALPGHKIDDDAHLARDTIVRYVYAAVAVLAFWGLVVLLFPNEGRKGLHLLEIGLATGTIGIVLLLGFQYVAAATQGMWMRGRGIGMVIFLIVKFIGWSYSVADDPDAGEPLSFVGFTCGVGLCEDLCKFLPLLWYFRRHARMGWRGAALWVLASGAGFGVSEGIMYSARYYNGISGADAYVVRFVSCVALHAIWSAGCGITLWRRQESVQGDIDRLPYCLAILRILAVPMILHGLYDTLLKRGAPLAALGTAAVGFVWLVITVEHARRSDPQPETSAVAA